MIKKILLALQFLTVIPFKVKSADNDQLAGSLIYFPLAGLIIGLALAGVNEILGFLNFPRLALDAILVVILAAITGGIHLDGLADTCDGLSSARSKEEILKIMRDPHIGVMGVVGIVSILLLKTTLLFSLAPSAVPQGLILACVLSRWSLVLSLFLFPYARQEGKAKIFSEGINPRIFILATLVAFICLLLTAGWKGLVIMGIVTLCVIFGSKVITRKIGGITGDTLGATNESAETIALFCVYF